MQDALAEVAQAATKESVDKLEEQVKENTTAITEVLKPADAKINETISQVQSQTAENTTKINLVVNSVEQHEVRINSLEIKTGQAPDIEIPDHSDVLKALQDQINDLSKRLAMSEASLEALTNVDEPETSVTGEINAEELMKHVEKMKVDIRKNTAHNAATNENTDKNTIDVAGLQNQLAQLLAEMEALKKAQAGGNSGTGAGASGVAMSESQLKALTDATNRIAGLEDKLNSLQGGLHNLQETVATNWKLGQEKNEDFEKQLRNLLAGLNDLIERLKDIEAKGMPARVATGPAVAA